MPLSPSALTTSRREGFLRAEPSRFLGRAAELDRLHHEKRLTTIVGPGGIGKTRLALRYGITRRADYPSVWFCDLSDVRNVDEMAWTTLRTLGLRDHVPNVGSIAVAAVERALLARPGALLILDNVEHLLPDAARIIHRWVEAAPQARFIVTSRRPLGLLAEQLGEERIELGALPIPPPGSISGDAVDLFVDRVRAHRGSYVPRERDLGSIAEIVRKLHGVPLAIELAAARLGVEDAPGELLSRVALPWANGGADEAPTAMVRRAVDRAWGLLLPWERQALAQASVFRRSFTLDAALRVVRLENSPCSVSEVLTTLARKCVLEVETYGPLRLAMCEGIRAHAAEVLASSPDASSVEWRHAEYCFDRAGQIAVQNAAELAESERDRDDLHAAMAFGASACRPEIVLRMALALDALSLGSGLSPTELAYLDEAIRAGAAGNLELVGRALGIRASALHALGRLSEAVRDATMALRLARELGDERQMGAMHRAAAESSFQLGDVSRALEHLEGALAVEQRRGDRGALAVVYRQFASVHQSLGHFDRARARLMESLELSVQLHDRGAECRAYMSLAWDHLEASDHSRAKRMFERALSIAERAQMARSVRIIHGYLGVLHFEADDWPKAHELLERATGEAKEAGEIRLEGIFEGIRAAVLACMGRVQEARSAFDLSSELLVNNQFYAGVIDIHRGHLDLAQAREARARGEVDLADAHVTNAIERIARAHEAPDGASSGDTRSLARRSDDARMAIHILERAIERAGL